MMKDLRKNYTKYVHTKIELRIDYTENLRTLGLNKAAEIVESYYGFNVEDELDLLQIEILEAAVEFMRDAEEWAQTWFDECSQSEFERFRKAVYDLTTVTLKETEMDTKMISDEFARFREDLQEIKTAVKNSGTTDRNASIGIAPGFSVSYKVKMAILYENILGRYMDKTQRIDDKYKMILGYGQNLMYL